MCPAIVSRMVTGDAPPISCWTIFSLYLVTLPEVFAKVNLAQVARFSKVPVTLRAPNQTIQIKSKERESRYWLTDQAILFS